MDRVIASSRRVMPDSPTSSGLTERSLIACHMNRDIDSLVKMEILGIAVSFISLVTASPAHWPTAPYLSYLDTIEAIPNCAAASLDTSFTIRDISYMEYLTMPGYVDQPPDTITMSFDVTNNANGIETACSFSNGKSEDGWDDNGSKWYSCGDRTMIDDSGSGYTVKTNAQFQWDAWVLGVNQTWVCGDGVAENRTNFAGKASTALVPVCNDTATESYTLKQCSALDTTAAVSLI
ncbi:hypothetical protein BJ170DRAFT_716052 [Xylariales sp. AK1849]|nr:hypothetical protein BJ170DRAFT_716052 [Xylariales sp. AK1849]